MPENLSTRGAASVGHGTCWRRWSTTVRAERCRRTTGRAGAGIIGEPQYATDVVVGEPQYELSVVGGQQYALDVVGASLFVWSGVDEPQYELSVVSVELSPG